MNERWRRRVAAGSVVAVVAVIVGSAIPVSSQQPAERTTLTFFDPRRSDFEKFINEGRRGFSAGDRFLFIENLKDPETCDPAGKIVGQFTVSKVTGQEDAFFLLEFGFRLPDGTITGYHVGKFSGFEGDHLAVTGGTQAYRDASGEFSIQSRQEMCGSRGDLITVDILL